MSCICPQPTQGTATFRARTATAEDALPVANAQIEIYEANSTTPIVTGVTDENGILEGIELSAPLKELSLNEDNTEKPYATYSLIAKREGYKTIIVNNFQVFDTVEALADLLFLPEDLSPISVAQDPVVTDVPEHPLYAGGGGSGPSPIQTCPVTRVLEEVIIPSKITVHLGRPTASAQDVTIAFIDYIKNVASSEIYPTWPEQSLRANIHAQISLALNRVYTEWYLSKGYNFQITNSTSYDQYYVHGRTIYDSVSVIADDIFNTYVRRTGLVDPYYTEYCDGKTATCSGMKQWGTVTLAEQGKSAIEILRYYYGSNIEIVRTNNIQTIPQSYPGTPLRVGSTGVYVKIIQRQLNRIAKNYPSFGTLNVDGVFGTSTADVVKRFQKQFSLTVDGVVGRDTWYKISYIYVAVKKLAELGSEGEAPNGDLVAGVYPGTALRIGSTGDNVFNMQFWLNEVATVTPNIPTLAVDGIFGVGTQASVRAFQEVFGLAVDGVVGQNTWDAIYREYTSLELDETPDITNPGQFPGTTLSVGSTGNDVKRMQFYLRLIARNNTSIPDIAADGIFGSGTENCVKKFQSFYGLTVDGKVGKLTWNKIYEVYTDFINGLLAPSERPGTYPGSPLSLGSRGQSVKEMQYYLYLLSAYYKTLPIIAYDGIFGTSTEQAVRVWQGLQGLTVDGIVGPATWASIYNEFSKLRNIDGTVNSAKVLGYPGFDLQLGSQGNAVKFVQFMLLYIGYFYDSILPISAVSGLYDEETKLSVESFQKDFGIAVTGIVDENTWNIMVILYLTCASEAQGNSTVPDGEYGGAVLIIGSTGLQVYRLQFYMNSIASRYCVFNFVPQDGIFDVATLNAVKSFQEGFGLPVTGFVDKETWDAIYAYYASLGSV